MRYRYSLGNRPNAARTSSSWGAEAQEPPAVQPQVGVPLLRAAHTVQGAPGIATSARSSTSGSCSVDCLTATVTATAADQLRLRLAFDRHPDPARRTIHHQKGLDKPDLEVGDAGLEPATSSL